MVGLTILTVKAAVFGGFAVLTRGTWNVDPGAAAPASCYCAGAPRPGQRWRRGCEGAPLKAGAYPLEILTSLPLAIFDLRPKPAFPRLTPESALATDVMGCYWRCSSLLFKRLLPEDRKHGNPNATTPKPRETGHVLYQMRPRAVG